MAQERDLTGQSLTEAAWAGWSVRRLILALKEDGLEEGISP